MKKIIVAFCIIMNGCVSTGYRDYYHQITPKVYKPTRINKIDVFHYDGLNINEVYNVIYGKDFEIIGKSSFHGGYENPGLFLKGFGAEKGADIILTSVTNEKATPYSYEYSVPYQSTSKVTNNLGMQVGTITSYGTKTEQAVGVAYTYDHNYLFLKNKNNIPKFWEQTEKDYPVKGASEYDGVYTSNLEYKIKLYRSGEVILGVINNNYESQNVSIKSWYKGEIKFIFGFKNLQGLCFMNDKTPMPTKLEIDENGYLLFKIPGDTPVKLAREE